MSWAKNKSGTLKKKSTTTKGGTSRNLPIPLASPETKMSHPHRSERLPRKSIQMELDDCVSNTYQDIPVGGQPPPSGSEQMKMV